jgi:hypothetical protein
MVFVCILCLVSILCIQPESQFFASVSKYILFIVSAFFNQSTYQTVATSDHRCSDRKFINLATNDYFKHGVTGLAKVLFSCRGKSPFSLEVTVAVLCHSAISDHISHGQVVFETEPYRIPTLRGGISGTEPNRNL